MRPSLVLGLLLLVSLAGCAEDGAPPPAADDTFDGVDVQVDDDTGAILGVVVDESITPVEGATVTLVGEDPRSVETDAEGRFVFDRVPAGAHFLEASKLNYESTQTSVNVEAGIEQPPVVKLQVQRLFSGSPYMEGIVYQGYIACAFSAGLTAPCVTDFTQVAPQACGTGCFPELRTIMGDARDTTYGVSAGWQSHIVELTWEPSAQGTSNSLGVILRDVEAPGASHQYAEAEGGSPQYLRLETGVVHPTQTGDDSKLIPADGYDSIIAFVGSRADGEPVSLTVQQEFEMFLHTFYYGKPQDGWSILNGDGNPF